MIEQARMDELSNILIVGNTLAREWSEKLEISYYPDFIFAAANDDERLADIPAEEYNSIKKVLEVRNEVVEGYIPLARKLCNNLEADNETKQELFGEAIIALIKATHGYNDKALESGTSFKTYAYRTVNSQLHREVINCRAFRLTSRSYDYIRLHRRVSEAENYLRLRNEELSVEGVVKFLEGMNDLKKHDEAKLPGVMAKLVSSSSATWHSDIPMLPRKVRVDETKLREERETAAKVLDFLPPFDRQIFNCIVQGKSYNYIAEKFDLTKSQVRNIVTRSRNELRSRKGEIEAITGRKVA